MNEQLNNILNVIQQSSHLTDHQRKALLDSGRQIDEELQINAALERVRAVAMAMATPRDLLSIGKSLFAELRSLGFEDLRNVILHVYEDDQRFFTDYDYSDVYQGHITRIPYVGNPITEKFIEKIRKSKEAFTEITIKDEEFEGWVAFRAANNEAQDERLMHISALYYYIYLVGDASIGISTFLPIAPEQVEILQRFRNVFDLAYKRYVDISTAEAQAKEARIEAALERVRAKSLAMRTSSELHEVAEVLFRQLMAFGENILNAGFVLCKPDADDDEYWMSSDTGIRPVISIPHTEEPLQKKLYEGWKNKLDFYSEAKGGEELAAHYRYLVSVPSLKPFFDEGSPTNRSFPTWQKWHAAYFDHGYIFLLTTSEYGEEKILIRFAKIFEQAYTRFLDLQKAEAQAREAQIEAALERVRGKAMMMQKSEDLSAAVAIVFEELNKLQIDLLRCGIGILDKVTRTAVIYSTTIIDNSSTVQVSGNEPMDIHPLLQNAFESWLNNEDYDYLLEGEDLKNYYEALTHVNFTLPASQSHVNAGLEMRQYYFRATASFGGLFSFSDTPLSTDSRKIIKRFAQVFEQTYTRFLDIKKAEAHALQAEQDLIEIKRARQKAEEALTELQLTQRQLVQSEKMASLGELTAGIAHEIQNPLNFVNNFSEVSKELLDEMKAALESGNKTEAEEIANDIIPNLEKITHHGKRADAIVKGMLQHSRATSTTKESSDINELADEYLRLAYHGLRAKDKMFNATLKTDYDQAIGRINIIPQDIGRVILNIITNAFYAVTEKKKSIKNGYEPTVTLTTKKIGDMIELRVADNGSGIPQKVVDKIFQPFFTTKPTGSGTGLGLSLAYDIIKVHGGEVSVATTEGEGSEFTIRLPMNNA